MGGPSTAATPAALTSETGARGNGTTGSQAAVAKAADASSTAAAQAARRVLDAASQASGSAMAVAGSQHSRSATAGGSMGGASTAGAAAASTAAAVPAPSVTAAGGTMQDVPGTLAGKSVRFGSGKAPPAAASQSAVAAASAAAVQSRTADSVLPGPGIPSVRTSATSASEIAPPTPPRTGQAPSAAAAKPSAAAAAATLSAAASTSSAQQATTKPEAAKAAAALPSAAVGATGPGSAVSGSGVDGRETDRSKADVMAAAAREAAIQELRAKNAAAKALAEELGIKVPVKKKKKPMEPITITVNQLMLLLLLVWASGTIGLALLLRVSWWHLTTFFAVGAGMGLAWSALYYFNVKRQAEHNQMLGLNVGLKGLQHLVGHLPSWLSYTEAERVEWLNEMLEEVWPYVDGAVCKEVKKQVEKLCADVIKSQPVPIHRIGFQQLTFGDAPFRVESVWVNEQLVNGDCLEMEVDVRWCGDANITLAVELSAKGGEMTKMCPQVSDISFVATLKIRLGPMCDKIPGFGALMFCFKKQPRIKYALSGGRALGGSAINTIVKPFINSIVKDQLNALLVWPQRMVIPMPLPHLQQDAVIQRGVLGMSIFHRGMLKVEVMKADGLHAKDWALRGEGTSDPFVILSTDAKYFAKTKVVKESLTPRWEQTFWLLVQEPESQDMQVTVYDYDLTGKNELMGRSLIKLKPITAVEPQQLTQWYHLGKGHWSDPAGCGKGHGRIKLKMMYRSFDNFALHEPRDATMGVLVVRVHKLVNMARRSTPVTLYCKFFCNDQEFRTAPVTSKDGKDHVFPLTNFREFHNVRFDTDVKVSVFQQTSVADEEVGFVELPITDIAEATDANPFTGQPLGGTMVRNIKLDESDHGIISLVLRYLPYY